MALYIHGTEWLETGETMENTSMEQEFPLKKFPGEKEDYQLNYFWLIPLISGKFPEVRPKNTWIFRISWLKQKASFINSSPDGWTT